MPTLNQLLDRIASLPLATQALPEVDTFKNKLIQLKRSPEYDQVGGLLKVEVPDNLEEILKSTVQLCAKHRETLCPTRFTNHDTKPIL